MADHLPNLRSAVIPYFADPDVTLYNADALDALREMPDQSVHMACTSPPFFGLRDYQTDGQIGLEPTVEAWAARLTEVFAQVRRVLRDDGVCFIEIGDSYDGNKELIDQPGILKNALRADGWKHRQTIIQAKPNAMPESVADRCTTSHSYVLLMVKSRSYYYDAEALREPAEWARWGDQTVPKYEGTETASGWIRPRTKNDLLSEMTPGSAQRTRGSDFQDRWDSAQTNGRTARNARSVWEISTEPNALAICRVCDAFWQGGAPRVHCGEPVVQHFAAFPRELVRRMILAGTSERGVCAECGTPWMRQVDAHTEIPSGYFPNSEGRRADEFNTRSHTSGTPNARRVVTTFGWQPGCCCRIERETGSGLLTDEGPYEVVPATILDPFAGSGTSLLVARQLGRHAIGIELNERYCAMTRARMSQLSLLTEAHS